MRNVYVTEGVAVPSGTDSPAHIYPDTVVELDNDTAAAVVGAGRGKYIADEDLEKAKEQAAARTEARKSKAKR